MKAAAIFPGQGSQSVGMGRYLVENFKSAAELFEEASDLLSLDFKKLCFEGPEADLALTENTQPALLLVSTATYRCGQEVGDLDIQACAGHSIGEYAAAVSAKVLAFSDALMAVRARGEAMQKAAPLGEGAMAAVMGLQPEQVKKLCAWVQEKTNDSPLEPANFNAPGQIVISGKKKLVDWLIENFDKDIFEGEELGRVKFIPLKVSAPFHCSLMKPAEEKMGEVLSALNFSEASHPLVQNFTAEAHSDGESIRRNLVSQVSGPVRWIECVEKLVNMGHKKHIEFGNGKVLAGLAKKIDPDLQVINLNNLEELKALENL